MSVLRRVMIIAAVILVIGGLLVCGPAHHALHAQNGLILGDLHGSDGEVSCDACGLSSVESPGALIVLGPLLRTSESSATAPPCQPLAQRPLCHAPRGPPARA